MTNQQKKFCPSVRLSVITITRVKRLEIEKFFFVPFCYVKRQAKFEDEQIRSSWSRDRVEKVLFWGSGNGFSHILLVNVIFCSSFRYRLWKLWVPPFKQKKVCLKRISGSEVTVDGVGQKRATRPYIERSVFWRYFKYFSSDFRKFFFVWKVWRTVKQWCGFECPNKMAAGGHLGF